MANTQKQNNTTAPAQAATEALAPDSAAILYGPTDAATKTTVVTDKDAVKLIKDAFGDERLVFDTAKEAFASLDSSVAMLTEDDDGTRAELPIPVVSRFATADEFGESRVAIGLMMPKVEVAGTKVQGIQAVIVYPIPTVEAFFESEAGKANLDKVTVKESSHVTFRQVRGSATIGELLDGMRKAPVSVEDYSAESRRAGGLDTKLFDTYWNNARKWLKKNMPALEASLPAKPEIRDCMRSQSYAMGDTETAKLEQRGMFAYLLTGLIKTATAAGKDASVLEGWLRDRESLEIERKTLVVDESALDFDLANLNFGDVDDSASESEAE